MSESLGEYVLTERSETRRGSLVLVFADGIEIKKENRKAAKKKDKNPLQVFKCSKVPLDVRVEEQGWAGYLPPLLTGRPRSTSGVPGKTKAPRNYQTVASGIPLRFLALWGSWGILQCYRGLQGEVHRKRVVPTLLLPYVTKGTDGAISSSSLEMAAVCFVKVPD